MTLGTFLVILGIALAFFLILRLLGTSRVGGAVERGVDPEHATADDIQSLVWAGRTIEAIKVYRRVHRVDLKTAKEAVERMAADLPPPPIG